MRKWERNALEMTFLVTFNIEGWVYRTWTEAKPTQVGELLVDQNEMLNMIKKRKEKLDSYNKGNAIKQCACEDDKDVCRTDNIWHYWEFLHEDVCTYQITMKTNECCPYL